VQEFFEPKSKIIGIKSKFSKKDGTGIKIEIEKT